MPIKPKIFVSVNSIQASVDLKNFQDPKLDFGHRVGVRRILDSDVFTTHFMLNLSSAKSPPDVAVPKDGIGINGIEICYLAYLP